MNLNYSSTICSNRSDFFNENGTVLHKDVRTNKFCDVISKCLRAWNHPQNATRDEKNATMFSSVQEEVQHYVSGIQVILTMMFLMIFWSFIIINKIIIIARRTMDYFKAPQQSSSQSLPDRSLTRMEGAACA